MVIHPDQTWLFVSTMKCATNTLYNILPQIGGARLLGDGFHPRPQRRMADIHFSVCRNPYDRAVSIWASTCLRDGDRYNAVNKIKSGGGDPENFEDFCVHCLQGEVNWTPHQWLFTNQSKWYDSTIIDMLVHIENLKPELESIVGEVPDLPFDNKSRHDEWKEYMTPYSIAIINEWAGEDFSLGYEKL